MTKKKMLIFFLIIIILLLFFKYDMYKYTEYLKEIKEFIESKGSFGIIIYIILYVTLVLACITPLPLAIMSGVIYGEFLGIIYTMIGAIISMSISFFITRYILRDFIENRLRTNKIYNKIQKGIAEEGWFILVITRILPIFPFGLQNYIYGLTKINFWTYIILSTILILPGMSVFIMLGSVTTQDNLYDSGKIMGIVAIVVLLLSIFTRIIKRKLKSKEENDV